MPDRPAPLQAFCFTRSSAAASLPGALTGKAQDDPQGAYDCFARATDQFSCSRAARRSALVIRFASP